ncbi:MAG: acyl-CoA thioesterase [Nitriliruptorales bacterium]
MDDHAVTLPPASEFDAGTAVERIADRRWRGDVSPDWTVFGGAPNGGYLQAMALRAVRGELTKPHPLTSTSHFLTTCESGPAEIDVEVLRTGRRHETAVATVHQADGERLRVTAIFGDLDAADGPTWDGAEPPAIPPLDECIAAPLDIDLPPVVRRFDVRLNPAHVGWLVNQPSGRAEMAGWLRFADGREPDVAALPLFADALPPVAFNVLDRLSWVPTLELTVHVRARPATGWLRCVFRSRGLVGGYHEEDGEIWDAEDRLVAVTRQLALARS